MPTSDKVSFQYIGPYGRKHFRARTAVGEVYYLEIVDIAFDQVTLLPMDEWRNVDKLCRFVHMGGKLCERLHIPGELFCTFHMNEFKLRAELGGDMRYHGFT